MLTLYNTAEKFDTGYYLYFRNSLNLGKSVNGPLYKESWPVERELLTWIFLKFSKDKVIWVIQESSATPFILFP